MLLGSPPDMVHGISLRGTDSSSPLIRVRQHSSFLGWEFIPAVADCRLQGTADSPTSAALPQTEGLKQSETSIQYFSPFFKGKMRIQIVFHFTGKYLLPHFISVILFPYFCQHRNRQSHCTYFTSPDRSTIGNPALRSAMDICLLVNGACVPKSP